MHVALYMCVPVWCCSNCISGVLEAPPSSSSVRLGHNTRRRRRTCSATVRDTAQIPQGQSNYSGDTRSMFSSYFSSYYYYYLLLLLLMMIIILLSPDLIITVCICINRM